MSIMFKMSTLRDAFVVLDPPSESVDASRAAAADAFNCVKANCPNSNAVCRIIALLTHHHNFCYDGMKK